MTTPKQTKAPSTVQQAQNKKWEDLLHYHLTLYGLGKFFVREFVSPPEFGRKWRWDFGDPINKVLLEVQGGIWIPKGAHNTGTAMMRDHEKQNTAALHGWVVFQFNDKTIKSLMALELVRDYYQRRGIADKVQPAAPF